MQSTLKGRHLLPQRNQPRPPDRQPQASGSHHRSRPPLAATPPWPFSSPPKALSVRSLA